MADAMEIRSFEVEGKTKYGITVGLTDDNGEPILDTQGHQRIVNLVGDSEQEVVQKLLGSIQDLSRKLERAGRRIETLRNAKPTPAQAPVKIEGKPLSSEEATQVGLDIQDPRKAAEAVKKVVESVVPVPVIASEIEKQSQESETRRRREVAREFILLHRDDYNPADANGAMMNQYLAANRLEYTLENLEIAFANLQGRLIAVARRSAETPPTDPNGTPPNAPPKNEPPRNDAPNPGNRTPQNRPAPTGGIRNRNASAIPADATTLTREQALHMLYNDPRTYEEWMRDPVKNAQLTRALAGTR